MCFPVLPPLTPVTLSKGQRPEADLDPDPLCQTDLKHQQPLFFFFFYLLNLRGRPKLRTGQDDTTSLLRLSYGRASDLLDQAFVGGQRAAACLPLQSSICAAPFEHHRYATLSLTALCNVLRTHTGMVTAEKSLPSANNQTYSEQTLHFASPPPPSRSRRSAPPGCESASAVGESLQ